MPAAAVTSVNDRTPAGADWTSCAATTAPGAVRMSAVAAAATNAAAARRRPTDLECMRFLFLKIDEPGLPRAAFPAPARPWDHSRSGPEAAIISRKNL